MLDTFNFDGVFRFTNTTTEDFTAFWNNKEYTFPAGKTVPIIIPDETPENIQEIRKRWAYQLAQKRFYQSKDYKAMVKVGKSTPSTYNEKILEPWIEECLKPLPAAELRVKIRSKDSDRNYKGSKAISEKDNPNYMFKDEPVQELGKMSDK